jgi:hypothetical protein
MLYMKGHISQDTHLSFRGLLAGPFYSIHMFLKCVRLESDICSYATRDQGYVLRIEAAAVLYSVDLMGAVCAGCKVRILYQSLPHNHLYNLTKRWGWVVECLFGARARAFCAQQPNEKSSNAAEQMKSRHGWCQKRRQEASWWITHM